MRTSITVSSQTPKTSRGPGTSKTCHSAVHYSSHCTGKSIVILAEKMVLGCNTIKEPFNRNMLQKDQVANYHRKRKHLDACRGRNDRLMEDYELFFFTNKDLQISEETQIFWNSDETTKNRESRQCEPERLAS